MLSATGLSPNSYSNSQRHPSNSASSARQSENSVPSIE